jgi:arylsulfatase
MSPAMRGKWHLTVRVREPDESWPTRRGFDSFYGIVTGASNYLPAGHPDPR